MEYKRSLRATLYLPGILKSSYSHLSLSDHAVPAITWRCVKWVQLCNPKVAWQLKPLNKSPKRRNKSFLRYLSGAYPCLSQHMTFLKPKCDWLDLDQLPSQNLHTLTQLKMTENVKCIFGRQIIFTIQTQTKLRYSPILPNFNIFPSPLQVPKVSLAHRFTSHPVTSLLGLAYLKI